MTSARSRVLVYALFLTLWELSSRSGWVDARLLPPPSVVGVVGFRLLVSGELLVDMFTSLARVAVGFSIAALLGIGVGLGVALSRRISQYAMPLVEIIRPIPPVAFIPISVLWFGVGNGPAYFLVSLAAFFPIMTSTAAGVLSVNPIHKEAALCLGARTRLLLTDVVLPSALPQIVTGLKSGLGTAWFVVIVAEMVGAQSGLGYMIQVSRQTLQTDRMAAGMVCIGVLGYLMNRIMVSLSVLVAPWAEKELAF